MENFRKTPSENLSWETDSRFMAKFGGSRPLGNYQKVILFTAQKTAPWDLSECPIFPQWADRAQNFVNVVAP